MFTLLIIIFVIYFVYKINSPDKKSPKKLAENNAAIAELPNIYLKAHEMSSAQKALNLWPSDNDLLDIFRYTKDDKCIYLKMKDGRSIKCPLAELDIAFDKVQATYRLVAKYNSMKFSFYGFPVFTDKEWDIIYRTLTLAGITRNVEIMGSTYKNITKVNTVLKIIKALS